MSNCASAALYGLPSFHVSPAGCSPSGTSGADICPWPSSCCWPSAGRVCSSAGTDRLTSVVSLVVVVGCWANWASISWRRCKSAACWSAGVFGSPTWASSVARSVFSISSRVASPSGDMAFSVMPPSLSFERISASSCGSMSPAGSPFFIFSNHRAAAVPMLAAAPGIINETIMGNRSDLAGKALSHGSRPVAPRIRPPIYSSPTSSSAPFHAVSLAAAVVAPFRRAAKPVSLPSMPSFRRIPALRLVTSLPPGRCLKIPPENSLTFSM